MQGMADPAPEDRSESDGVPAKLRKCSGKRSEEWKILDDIGGTRELGGSASGFDGFEEITVERDWRSGKFWKISAGPEN